MLDDCGGNGGGGDDPAHDPEVMRHIAKVVLKTMAVNCEINNVCEFHTGLYLIALMGESMEKALKNYEGGMGVVDMAAEMITTLDDTSDKVLMETAKWKTTPLPSSKSS